MATPAEHIGLSLFSSDWLTAAAQFCGRKATKSIKVQPGKDWSAEEWELIKGPKDQVDEKLHLQLGFSCKDVIFTLLPLLHEHPARLTPGRRLLPHKSAVWQSWSHLHSEFARACLVVCAAQTTDSEAGFPRAGAVAACPPPPAAVCVSLSSNELQQKESDARLLLLMLELLTRRQPAHVGCFCVRKVQSGSWGGGGGRGCWTNKHMLPDPPPCKHTGCFHTRSHWALSEMLCNVKCRRLPSPCTSLCDRVLEPC